MKVIRGVQYKNGSKEELLPDFSPDFPYIASYVELSRFPERQSPWHWHKEVELFYVEQGALEYDTPKGSIVFPAGSGGLVNSNVLHMAKTWESSGNTVQLLHIFDAGFIGGWQGSRIEQKYIAPLVSAPQAELIGFYPDNPGHAELLDLLCRSFRLSSEEYAYEIMLRSVLSEIWYRLLTISQPLLSAKGPGKTDDNQANAGLYP